MLTLTRPRPNFRMSLLTPKDRGLSASGKSNTMRIMRVDSVSTCPNGMRMEKFLFG